MYTANYLYCNPRRNYTKTVDIPIELYESIRGEYFIGYVEGLSFGDGKSAWVRLFNPPHSGINLHVNVWTVTDISESSFRAEFWFNTEPPGIPLKSDQVTPSNMAIRPLPVPKVKLEYAVNVSEEPSGGAIAFIRNGQAGTTVVDTENGKLIFPPGGSFLVYLSLTGTEVPASGRIAFGWWEESIKFEI